MLAMSANKLCLSLTLLSQFNSFAAYVNIAVIAMTDVKPFLNKQVRQQLQESVQVVSVFVDITFKDMVFY
jgi:hypothetical protein